MSDLEIAIEVLNSNNLKLAIYKNNKELYISDERGIKPLYMAYNSLGSSMVGSSCADIVVGKAAAYIYGNSKIKSLSCEVITKEAKLYLESCNIEVKSKNEVDYILNRAKDGKCPVETIAQDENNFSILMSKIKLFLQDINAI